MLVTHRSVVDQYIFFLSNRCREDVNGSRLNLVLSAIREVHCKENKSADRENVSYTFEKD
jgi:hypothetical protein